jgi:SAM-dependent methyltransferase
MATPQQAIPNALVETVPLAVWPCAQTTGYQQRRGRYVSESIPHPGKMLPELARRIVLAYSQPRDLIVDPMCGVGTTLVEAAALDRRCIGIELEDRWVGAAQANLRNALTPRQRRLADVRQGDARLLSKLLRGVRGRVGLVVLAPPYAIATAEVFEQCRTILRAGRLLVAVTRNVRRGGRLLDRASITIDAARSAGFGYLQHNIALHAALRDGELASRPSFWQLSQTQRARARGLPLHLVAHEDVLVFIKEAARHG